MSGAGDVLTRPTSQSSRVSHINSNDNSANVDSIEGEVRSRIPSTGGSPLRNILSSSDTSPSASLRRNQSIQRFNTLNPNAYWMNSKGAWVTYVALIILTHLSLLAMPWFGTDMAWTLTNVVHGIAMYTYFHHVKGLPFDSTNFDPDCSFRLTLWEQLDDGKQYTDTRKFLICVPIVLFILVSFYTKHEMTFFLVNFIVLMFNLVPKLPYLHKKRLFGINKY